MSETHDGGSPSSVKSTVQAVVLYLVVIAIALVGGYYLAVALIPTPKIGIINLVGPIGGATARTKALEINYALHADDIRGVLLVVNSPGGSASAGHDIYFQVRKLRDKMPVVTSVDSIAASAAYQVAIATNEIYAKPASFVGSVGVLQGSTRPETLNERLLTTGPFKATAFSTTDQIRKLDLLLEDFRNSVITERTAAPNPLTLPPEKVATGEIWVGIESMEYGLIDQLGSSLDAIDRVAELAGLEEYEVVDVRTEYLDSLEESQLTAALGLYEEVDAGIEFDLSSEEQKWPELYQLYIPLE